LAGVDTTFAILPTPVYGCTDGNGTYTALGAAGMTPINGQVWGACNYDPTANTDDGSCDYTSCAGCTNSAYIEYDAVYTLPSPVVAVAAGYCTTPINSGCNNPAMFSYDPAFNADCSGNLPSSTAYASGGTYGATYCCIPFIYGCTDGTYNISGSPQTYASANYDPTVNTDDSSCDAWNCPTGSIVLNGPNLELELNGINTPYNTAVTYTDDKQISLEITDNNGSLIYSDLDLVTQPTSSNLIWLQLGGTSFTGSIPTSDLWSSGDIAGTTSLTVEYTIATTNTLCSTVYSETYTVGCMNSNADVYGGFAIADNTQCTYTGCMDATPQIDGSGYAAMNYDLTNTISDGSQCLYPNSPNPSIYFSIYTSGMSDFITVNYKHASTGYGDYNITNLIVGGGTTTSTENFSGSVTAPDYSGSWTVAFLNSITSQLYNWVDYVDGGTLKIHSGQATFDGVCDNDSLIPINELPTVTQTQSAGSAAFPDANYSVGCKYQELGGVTYANLNANLDLHLPGSCIENIPGCMDSGAINYDENATADCGENYGGSDQSCCCSSCADTGALALNDILGAGVINDWAESVSLSFTESLCATSYTVFWNLEGGSTQVFSISTNDINLVNGVYTFSPGTIAFTTPLGGFTNTDRYFFKIRSNCITTNGTYTSAWSTLEVITINV